MSEMSGVSERGDPIDDVDDPVASRTAARTLFPVPPSGASIAAPAPSSRAAAVPPPVDVQASSSAASVPASTAQPAVGGEPEVVDLTVSVSPTTGRSRRRTAAAASVAIQLQSVVDGQGVVPEAALAQLAPSPTPRKPASRAKRPPSGVTSASKVPKQTTDADAGIASRPRSDSSSSGEADEGSPHAVKVRTATAGRAHAPRDPASAPASSKPPSRDRSTAASLGPAIAASSPSAPPVAPSSSTASADGVPAALERMAPRDDLLPPEDSAVIPYQTFSYPSLLPSVADAVELYTSGFVTADAWQQLLNCRLGDALFLRFVRYISVAPSPVDPVIFRRLRTAFSEHHLSAWLQYMFYIPLPADSLTRVVTGAELSRLRMLYQDRDRRMYNLVKHWGRLSANLATLGQTLVDQGSATSVDVVYCDPALIFLPRAPLFWMPQSSDLLEEFFIALEEAPCRGLYATRPDLHP